MKFFKTNKKLSFKTNLLISFSTLLIFYILITGVFSFFIFNSDIKDIEKNFGQSFLNNSMLLEETIKTSHEEGFNILIDKDIAHILYGDIEELSSGKEELLKVIKKISGLKTSLPYTISNIFIYSGGNTVFTISGVDEFPLYLTKFAVYDKYDAESWKEIKTNIKNFQIIESTIETINRKETYVIPVLISYGTGKQKSLMVICISVDAIISNFKKSKVFEQEIIICLDENDNEVFFIGDESKHDIILNDVINSGSTMLQSEKIFGRLKYKIVSVVDDYGYKYAYYVPFNAIVEKAIKNNLKVVVLFISVFAVGLVLTFIFSVKLYKPIKDMVELLKSSDDYYTNFDIGRKELEVINDLLSTISNDNKKIKKQYNTIKSRYIDKLFFDILEGHEVEKDIEQFFRGEVKFSDDSYTCALLDISINENLLKDTTSVDKMLMVDKMASVLSNIMSEVVKVYYVEIKKFNYVFIFNAGIGERNKIIKALKSVLNIFELDKSNGSIRIGLGKSYYNIDQISKSFSDAETVLLYNYGDNRIFDSEDMDFRQYYIISTDERTGLVNMLKAGDYSSLNSKVNEIFLNNLNNFVSASGLKSLIYELYNIGFRDLSRKGINIEDLISKEINHKLSYINEDINKVGYETLEIVLLLYRKICEKSVSPTDDRKYLITNQVLKYIKANYKKSDLYLEVISDAIGLSHKYITKVFKEIEGVSVVDYIARYRVDKAKKLLVEGMKIEDVAKEVGFENRTTFFRTFKKYEGISPAYYKKIYSN